MTRREPRRWAEAAPDSGPEARAAQLFLEWGSAAGERRPGPQVQRRLRVTLSQQRPPRTTKPSWLLAALVLVLASAAAAAGAFRSSAPAPAPASPPQAVAATEPSRSPPKAPQALPSSKATASVPEPSARLAAPAARAAASSSELERESSALARAVSALKRDHSPDRALAVLDEYRAEFPRGRLALEASVLRVEALMAAGRRAEALAALERMPLERMPRSAELIRLRDSLRGEGR